MSFSRDGFQKTLNDINSPEELREGLPKGYRGQH
jgi:hypothetical protein